MYNLIIVNEDNTVSRVGLSPNIDWSKDGLLQKEADKIGGIIYDGEIPEVGNLKFVDGVVVVDDDADNKDIQDKANKEARKYLSSTDWYITRKAETGIEVPQDILDKRAEARASII